MFTDRFIEVPVKIYSLADANLTGKKEYISTYRKINPMEITEYGPTDEDGDDQLLFTSVSMRGGVDKFIAFVSVEEFEKLLNEYGK